MSPTRIPPIDFIWCFVLGCFLSSLIVEIAANFCTHSCIWCFYISFCALEREPDQNIPIKWIFIRITLYIKWCQFFCLNVSHGLRECDSSSTYLTDSQRLLREREREKTGPSPLIPHCLVVSASVWYYNIKDIYATVDFQLSYLVVVYLSHGSAL